MIGNWWESYWIAVMRQDELLEEAELRRKKRRIRKALREERKRAKARARTLRSSQAARSSLALIQNNARTECAGTETPEPGTMKVSGEC
jgi:hypothetical protein